ncbi:MAG: thiol-disulfide oxidoreductase DCC family protein [Planctomycetota bacterium]
MAVFLPFDGTTVMACNLTLIYDGDCPICSREVNWLKRRDRRDELALEDLAAEEFDPQRYGLSREDVTMALHGVKPDGSIVRGMEAVREAYRTVGLGWIVAPTGWPGVRRVSDWFYAWFARHRLSIGRLVGKRCGDGTCHHLRDESHDWS